VETTAEGKGVPACLEGGCLDLTAVDSDASARQTEVTVMCHHERRNAMPLLNVKVIGSVFSPEQKSEMISRLTETMVEFEGEGMRGVTWVVVEEVQSGDWGIGGQALRTEDVKALQDTAPEFARR
jgi:4-oxalocrotonate tautomerase